MYNRPSSYSAEDIAFIAYARHKEIPESKISLIIDKPKGAISGQYYYFKKPELYKGNSMKEVYRQAKIILDNVIAGNSPAVKSRFDQQIAFGKRSLQGKGAIRTKLAPASIDKSEVKNDFSTKGLGWQANDFAFLKFCKKLNVPYKEIALIMGRTESALQQKASAILQFETTGRTDRPKETDNIRRGLQMENRISNDISFLEHRKAWLEKINKYSTIKHSIDPHIFEIKKKLEEESTVEDVVEEIEKMTVLEKPKEEPVLPKEDQSLPETPKDKPFFSINLDIDGIVRIIKAFKGN